MVRCMYTTHSTTTIKKMKEKNKKSLSSYNIPRSQWTGTPRGIGNSKTEEIKKESARRREITQNDWIR